MADQNPVSGPAVLDHVPAADEFGQVVRVIGPIVVADTFGVLHNGVETPVSAVPVPILIANPARRAAVIQNTGTANIRVGDLGVTATTGLRLAPDDYMILELPYAVRQTIYAIREGLVDSIAFALEITT